MIFPGVWLITDLKKHNAVSVLSNLPMSDTIVYLNRILPAAAIRAVAEAVEGDG